MRIYLLALLLLILAGCQTQTYELDQKGQVSVHTETETYLVDVEIPQTTEEMMQGLMYREHLAQDKGMLFIFPEPKKYSFWMKNTKIPLDMVFIDEAGVIVDILAAEPCITDECPSYIPQNEVIWVLEVNQGWSAEHGVKKEDVVMLSS